MATILAPGPDVLLTEAQAAHLLSLKPHTLQRWRARETGPAFVMVGGAVRYRRLTLSAWLSVRPGPVPEGTR
jgi:hypothetical protein